MATPPPDLYKPAPLMTFSFDHGARLEACPNNEIVGDLGMAFLTDRGAGVQTEWWQNFARQIDAGPGAGNRGLPSPEVRRRHPSDLLFLMGGVDFLRVPRHTEKSRRSGCAGVASGERKPATKRCRPEPTAPEAAARGEVPPALLKGLDTDARWLERKISTAFPELDLPRCQRLAEDTLEILADLRGDDRDAENRLATLFDHRELGLIRLLVCKRDLIVWCTRFWRKKDEKRRRKMEEESAVSVCSSKFGAMKL